MKGLFWDISENVGEKVEIYVKVIKIKVFRIRAKMLEKDLGINIVSTIKVQKSTKVLYVNDKLKIQLNIRRLLVEKVTS